MLASAHTGASSALRPSIIVEMLRMGAKKVRIQIGAMRPDATDLDAIRFAQTIDLSWNAAG